MTTNIARDKNVIPPTEIPVMSVKKQAMGEIEELPRSASTERLMPNDSGQQCMDLSPFLKNHHTKNFGILKKIYNEVEKMKLR